MRWLAAAVGLALAVLSVGPAVAGPPQLTDAKGAGEVHVGLGILSVSASAPMFAIGYLGASQFGQEPARARDFAGAGYTGFRFGMAFGLASIIHGGRMLRYRTAKKRARFVDLVDNPTWRHLHWMSAVLGLNGAFAMPSMLRHLVYPGLRPDAVMLEGLLTIAVAGGGLVGGIMAGIGARLIEERYRRPRFDDPDDLDPIEYDVHDYDEDFDYDLESPVLPPPILGIVPARGGATAVVIGLW